MKIRRRLLKRWKVVLTSAIVSPVSIVLSYGAMTSASTGTLGTIFFVWSIVGVLAGISALCMGVHRLIDSEFSRVDPWFSSDSTYGELGAEVSILKKRCEQLEVENAKLVSALTEEKP